jgi:hypothetical protein
VQVNFEGVEVFDFLARQAGQRGFDLLVAHAFLDLVDIPAVLPGLFALLRPGGLFYFTLNFDGLTILEPALDPALDEQVMALYHRSMDERRVDGRQSGDSRAGRHLFTNLRRAGAELLAAGASDWVVYAGRQGYPGDEAYFLHFIIYTIDQQLRGHPELDRGRFSAWVRERHAQAERASWFTWRTRWISLAGWKQCEVK